MHITRKIAARVSGATTFWGRTVSFSSLTTSIASISIHEDSDLSEVSHFWIVPRILVSTSAGSRGNGAKSEFQLESETADSINSVTIDVNHGLGKRLRSLLRQVVADAAGDEPVVILAGELVTIGCARRMDCSVGVALHGDGWHGDDRKRGQPLFEVVIFPLTIC